MADAKALSMILIASDGEWAGRSLESVLVANHYSVLRTGDGADAIKLARRYRPDAIILDEALATISGVEVCTRLREDPQFDLATPIIVTAASPSSRTARNAAYAAGAWDYCTHPLDADTLVPKLRTFLGAKGAVSQARESSMYDQYTGVLSPTGFEKWAEQLAARAIRNHEPLACVAIMPTVAPVAAADADKPRVDPLEAFLELAREAFRRSDIVGRTPDGLLVLLAPDTDPAGVSGLLARLRKAVNEAALSRPDAVAPPEFKAGFWAVQDFSSAPLQPAELMRRAASALGQSSGPIAPGKFGSGFEQLPVS